MSTLDGWRHRLRVLLDRRSYDAEIARERDFHLELEAMQQRAAGLGATDATHLARKRFGNRTGWQAERRALAPFAHVAQIAYDVRFALRQLGRAPLLVVGVVGTFAVGLGAAGATFDLLDRTFLRPPAYLAHADRISRVVFQGGDYAAPTTGTDYRTLADLRQHTTSFERMVAVWTSTESPVGTGAQTKPLPIAGVGAELWGLFAMRPVVGQFFTVADDQPPTGRAVAVLGYQYWQEEFGGAPSVIGRTLQVGARLFTIIGVAPENFRAFSRATEPAVFVPLSAAAAVVFGDDNGGLWASEYGGGWLSIFALRRSGVAPLQATTDLTQVYTRSRQAALEAQGRSADANEAPAQAIAAHVLAERGPQRSRNGNIVLWLVGVAVILLLLACSNVSQLLLAHGDRRTHEFAVRGAIGMSRWRLAQQLLTEGVVLAVIGGAVGAGLAAVSAGLLRRLVLAQAPGTEGHAIEMRTLVIVGLLALLTGLLSALVPAWRTLRRPITPGLKLGGRSGTHEMALVRRGLLVGQTALSVVLLVGALLFVRSVRNVNALTLGFDAERVVYLRPEQRSAALTPTELEAVMERLATQLRADPQVESVSRGSSVPFWNSRKASLFGATGDTLLRRTRAVLQVADASYFQTLGTTLKRGRGILRTDQTGGEPVAVVSDSLAARAWPGRDALGQCLRVGADSAPCVRVVGIAQAIRRDGLFEDEGLQFYLPAAQASPGLGGLFVRVRGSARLEATRLRALLQPQMPGDSYLSVLTLEMPLDPLRRPWRVGAWLFTGLGALALLLACGGLYAIIAYEVTRRSHELAVRLAIGARQMGVVRMVFFDTMRASLLGLAIGVVLALLFAPRLADQLYAVNPRDPWSLFAAVGLLLTAAVVAAWVPAMRAARVSPAMALRDL